MTKLPTWVFESYPLNQIKTCGFSALSLCFSISRIADVTPTCDFAYLTKKKVKIAITEDEIIATLSVMHSPEPLERNLLLSPVILSSYGVCHQLFVLTKIAEKHGRVLMEIYIPVYIR